MDEEDAKSVAQGYESFWGALAEPVVPSLGLQASIAVPLWAYRGPLLRTAMKRGDDVEAAVKELAREALLAWYRRYQGRRSAADAGRRRWLLQMIPKPARGEPKTRVMADLRGAVQEAAFARVVDVRFGATREGRRMALREALVEHLAELNERGAAGKQE